MSPDVLIVLSWGYDRITSLKILSEMKFQPQTGVLQTCLSKNLTKVEKREIIFYKKAKYIEMWDHFAI